MITAEMSAKGRATMAAKFLRLRIGDYPKSKSHKVNRYVRLMNERKACENYLKEIEEQLRMRMFALSGSQHAEARRILDHGPLEEI